MESEARESGEAPEAPVEQVAQDVEAEADTLKDEEIDPLASTPGGDADAAPPEPDVGPSAEEGQVMQSDHSAQQEPIQSAPPPVTEAPPEQQDAIVEPEPPKPAQEAPKAPEPAHPAASAGNTEPAEPTIESASAQKEADSTIEAPKVVSDMAEGASTSHGAASSPILPTHGGPTLRGLNGAAPQPSTGEASYRDIQVVPSEHHGSGPNFYDVTSVSAEGKPVATKRRFDDLVQLHEDLKRRFRGCVIPFRPGKTKTNSTVIMSHGEGFLKERAFAIKCYLNKVVQHPDMKACEMLRQFMESTEVLRDSTDWTKEQLKKPGMVTGFFTSVKKLAGAVPRLPTPSQVMQGSGKSEHDLVRQMAEMRVSRRALHDHADVAERALLDMGDHVADMLKANQALSTAAMALIDAKRKLIDTHADNGQGLHTLTKFEKDGAAAASLPEDLRLREKAVEVMAACVEAFGRTCGEAMHNAVVRQMAVLEPIHDHAHTLPRVEKALASRLDALVVLESLRRQEGIINASYQQLLAKELGGVMRNADVLRMNRVREEVDQVQQAKAAAEKSYDLLKHRNERDIELYQTERNMSFCFLTLKFAEAHASLQSAVADVWEAMAAQAGADMTAIGPGGTMDLAYGALGEQVSRSAVVIERDIDANPGASSGPVGEHGPLPPELEGLADDD